ncbi:MAG: ROK family protein [Limisphaerales bacterium]
MSTAGSYVLGLDLGGSSVKAVALSPDGDSLAEANRPFEAERPGHFAETVRDLAGDMIRARGGAAPASIGLSAPGLPARDGRSIAYLPNRLAGIEGLDWSEFLGLGVAIPVLNDAQAALVGESWLGAARGRSNVVLLTLGTGVGGAAMVDGHLLRGHVGKAGHVGHISLDPEGERDICGTPGSLELAIGNVTVSERSGGRYATTHALIDAHRAGDPKATRIWLKSVRALAAGIVSLANVLDPEVVVVGGGIAAAGDALFGPLRERIGETEWRACGHAVRIVPARLGDKAGAVGAARHGMVWRHAK